MKIFVTPCALILFSGCFALSPSNGGGQTRFSPPRAVNVADVALPDGYVIEVVAQGFTFPTAVVLDDQDRVHVLEAGYSYGDVFDTPRLLRLNGAGEPAVVATGDNPPWTGASFHEGAFYVSEGGTPGRILRISPDGAKTVLVDNLPGLVDHHTNRPVAGPDGFLYFGQGTATNSGVVGEDNADMGWLQLHPEFHDVPGGDIVLTGQNFESPNPLTADPNDTAITGAYFPFGTPSMPNQRIPGTLPCTGAIMRVPLTGGPLELVAWGLRNPFGLAFAPDGSLYTTENGLDDRGSRPVFGGADYLYKVTSGAWYGWPDFAGGRPLNDDYFGEGGVPQPKFLLAEHPGTPPKPAAELEVHSSSNGIAFSRSPAFGHVGQAFVAQLGDMAPEVGKTLHAAGFKVVRVDVDTGVVTDFAVNKGDFNGPASKLKHGGLERPIDVSFNSDGTALYILDFGIMTMDSEPHPEKGTGVLWRVRRAGAEGE